MIDPNSFERERNNYSKVVTLYCCDNNSKNQKSNDESLLLVSACDFWKMTRRCENIAEISIPGNLEMKIDTLKERLPKLKRVIIRIHREDGTIEEHKLSSDDFRSFFSQKLIVGKNGITMSDLPNNPRRPSYKIVPYLPNKYPNIEEAAICSDVYEDNLDYKKIPSGSGPDLLINGLGSSTIRQPKFGRICEGIEIIQLAKDCINK